MANKKLIMWYKEFIKKIISIKKLKYEHWGFIIGSSILFLSWIVDKNYQSSYQETKEGLQRSQLVVDIEEVHRSLYDLAYAQEIRKQPCDSFLLAFAALGQTRTKINLYTWGLGRVNENSKAYDTMVAVKNTIIQISEESMLSRNYKKLFEAHALVSKVFVNNYMQNDKKFTDKYGEVKLALARWNSIFKWLYAIGTILLGVSYVIEKTRSVKTE